MDLFKGIKPRTKTKPTARPTAPGVSSRPANYRKSQAEIMAAKRRKERDIGEIPAVVDPDRRESTKWNLELFLTTYYPHVFYNPFTEDQKAEIADIQYIILNGGSKCKAAPRGDGKTSRIEGAGVWAIVHGHRRFLVNIGPNREHADEMLASLKTDFETNDRLFEDFPEICHPIRALEGIAHRAKGQLYKGTPTRIGWSANELVLPTIPGSAASGAIIRARGIEGGIRGFKKKTADGQNLRPDLVIIDDAQTEKSAHSRTQTDFREGTIKKAIKNLAAQGKNLGVVMLCTVIEKGDLSDRFLDQDKNPQWRGTRSKMVDEWPADAVMELWETAYYEVWKDGQRKKDGGAAANAFYLEHRDRLDAGFVVSNPHRYEETEISAIQSAMHILFDIGRPAFSAEYQNDPLEEKPGIYDLKPEIVARNLNGLKRGVVPADANFLVAMSDINYVGMKWVVVAFKNDFTGFIIDYGKHPGGRSVLVDKNTPDTVAGQKIAAGVLHLATDLMGRTYTRPDGSPVRIQRLLIDANRWTDSVFAAVRQLNRPQEIICDRGTAASKYHWRKERIIGQPWHKCHYEKSPDNHGYQIRHDSDFWRMTAQKSFLLPAGVPGSLSLWGRDPEIHMDFSGEICAERLQRYEPGTPDLYSWHRVPGVANDLLDGLVGTFPAAASLGATIPGHGVAVARTQKRPPRRQTKVPIQ